MRSRRPACRITTTGRVTSLDRVADNPKARAVTVVGPSGRWTFTSAAPWARALSHGEPVTVVGTLDGHAVDPHGRTVTRMRYVTRNTTTREEPTMTTAVADLPEVGAHVPFDATVTAVGTAKAAYGRRRTTVALNLGSAHRIRFTSTAPWAASLIIGDELIGRGTVTERTVDAHGNPTVVLGRVHRTAEVYDRPVPTQAVTLTRDQVAHLSSVVGIELTTRRTEDAPSPHLAVFAPSPANIGRVLARQASAALADHVPGLGDHLCAPRALVVAEDGRVFRYWPGVHVVG